MAGQQLTHGGELGSNVNDHDDGHDQGNNVHEVVGRFEDDGVGHLDATGIAGRIDSSGACQW